MPTYPTIAQRRAAIAAIQASPELAAFVVARTALDAAIVTREAAKVDLAAVQAQYPVDYSAEAATKLTAAGQTALANAKAAMVAANAAFEAAALAVGVAYRPVVTLYVTNGFYGGEADFQAACLEKLAP